MVLPVGSAGTGPDRGEPRGTDPARPLSQSFRFPAGRSLRPEAATRLGLEASFERVEGETATVKVASRRLAYGVRLHVPGFVALDDAFGVEPGHARTIELRRTDFDAGSGEAAHVTALNLTGRVRIDT